MQIKSHSHEQTQQIAKDLVKQLNGGDIIGLEGDLGSGKTTFVQGLAKALGITQNITSPTFTIMQVYAVENHPTIKYLCHIDAYRLESKGDVESAGIAEYIGQPDTLSIIEWPEKVSSILPYGYNKIKFSHLSENERIIDMMESL